MLIKYLIIANIIYLTEGITLIIIAQNQPLETYLLYAQISLGIFGILCSILILSKQKPDLFNKLFLLEMIVLNLAQFEMILIRQQLFRILMVGFINWVAMNHGQRQHLIMILLYIYYLIRSLIIVTYTPDYITNSLFTIYLVGCMYNQYTLPLVQKQKEVIEELVSYRTCVQEQVKQVDLSQILNQVKQGIIYLNSQFEIVYVNRKAMKQLQAQNQEISLRAQLQGYLLKGLKQDDDISNEQQEVYRRASQKHLTQKTGTKILQNLMQSAEKRIKRIQAISEKLLDQKRKKRNSRVDCDPESFKSLLSSFFEQTQKLSSLLEYKKLVKVNKLKLNLNEVNSKTLEFQFCSFQEIKKSEEFIIFINDVTEVEQLQKYISQYQFQNFHFNSFSHELRTPLNCSLTLLQALRTQLEDKDLLQTYLDPAIVQNKLLMHQINDILDYASFGLQSFQLNVNPFDIASLFNILDGYYSQACLMKGIQLDFIIKDRLGNIEILSDKDRILQLLVNLINNSLKFTLAGNKITVIAQEKVKSGMGILNDQYIKFIVYDNGRGITVQGLKAINNIINTTLDKDIFYQLKNFTTKYVGLGFTIGCRMSKELAMAQKSYFKIRSHENEFTKVSFRVKNQTFSLDQKVSSSIQFDRIIEIDSEINVPPTPLTNQHQRLPITHPTFFVNQCISIANIPQILLCDDVAFNLMSLKLLIKIHGFDSDLAYDGKQAIDFVTKRVNSGIQQYKMVFMDIEMPGMNGYETTRQLKLICPKLVVLMCSAYDSQDNIQQAYESGMKDYIIKPVRVDQLRQIMQKYLN